MSRAPNILFIMSDDHASHAVSCYCNRINRTPQLDCIAAGDGWRGQPDPRHSEA